MCNLGQCGEISYDVFGVSDTFNKNGLGLLINSRAEVLGIRCGNKLHPDIELLEKH